MTLLLPRRLSLRGLAVEGFPLPESVCGEFFRVSSLSLLDGLDGGRHGRERYLLRSWVGLEPSGRLFV